MIDPNQTATIDELTAALVAMRDAAVRGYPISNETGRDVRDLADELKTRKATRDEILRIAEEMAEEEAAAEAV